MQQSEATGLPYLDLSSEIIQVRGQRLDSTLLHLEDHNFLFQCMFCTVVAFLLLLSFSANIFGTFMWLEFIYPHETGSIATGELNFTSTEPLELHPPSSTQHVNASDIDAPDSSMNPFSASMDDHRASSEPIDLTGAEPASSACSGQKGSGSGKKRSIAGVLQGYLDHKIKQSKTFVESLDETSKGDYSIKKCMDLLESMEELSDEEKAQATSVMKCEVNREIFINFTNPRVRLLWIKGEIAPKVSLLFLWLPTLECLLTFEDWDSKATIFG